MWLLQRLKLNSNCHGISSVRTAQRQFFCLLLGVISCCLLLEFFWPLSAVQRPPIARKPTVYLTSECGYERRLGNTMFTLAATLGISQRNRMTSVIEYRTPLRDAFQLNVLLSHDIPNTMSGSFADYFEYGRRGSAYDRSTENISAAVGSRMNVRLRGYFQSWRYFDNVVDELRENFVFIDEVSTAANQFLNEVAPKRWMDAGKDFVRVGIHVRRGDMSVGYFRDYGYTTAPVSYFESAMQRFVANYSRVQFVVCTDDISWCKNNIPSASSLGSENNIDVIFSSTHTQFVDLAILARCNHTIMSVGSFGWWAAWLANGTTIYYADWPRPVSMLEYHVNKMEYFPRHWISLR